MKKIIYILICLTLFSCDDYLDIQPKGQLIPKTAEEYDYLLNGYDIKTTPNLQYSFSPYFVPFNYNTLTDNWKKAYRFKEYTSNEAEDDWDWNSAYKVIFICNTVINGVKELEQDSEAKRVIAEAKLHRAYIYFILTNLYALQYNEATASSALAVPIVNDANFENKPTRATVAQVYKLILDDVNESIEFLPKQQRNRVRPSQAAAYGLLSRVYLYQKDFINAEKYAKESLKLYNKIHDFNSGWYPAYLEQNTELTWAKSANSMSPLFWMTAMTKFKGALKPRFENGDLRIMPSKFVPFGVDLWFFEMSNRYAGVGVPELHLTIAECRARENDIQGALAPLNHIRKFRFSEADYIELTKDNYLDNTPDDVNNLFERVLLERERELLFKGHYFFDVKRLNAEGKWNKDLVREETTVVDGENITKTYTLKANSNLWMMAIPPKVIMEFNSGLEQNSR